MKNRKIKKASTIRTSNRLALKITRDALDTRKAVYIAKANKKIKYQWGKSFIAYIGETSIGTKRIATSAAERAPEVLKDHGIKHLDFYVIKWTGRQSVKTWEELERSLLITFREIYGETPKCNEQGKKLDALKKSEHFREPRLKKIILKYSQ